jgi:hypothetical protein
VNKNNPVSQEREMGFLFWNIRRNLKNAAIADIKLHIHPELLEI